MDDSVHPVRAYRRRHDLSLDDLAARIDTTKANLSRIEGRKQRISRDLLFKLVAETAIPARKLDPDLAKLFGARRPVRRARAA
jgi:transcriptional regulator with XRE-family HTH domain